MSNGTGVGTTTVARTTGMAIGGAVGVLIVWVLGASGMVAEVPAEVAVAIGAISAYVLDMLNPAT